MGTLPKRCGKKPTGKPHFKVGSDFAGKKADLFASDNFQCHD
jgi:hypothetical protein